MVGITTGIARAHPRSIALQLCWCGSVLPSPLLLLSHLWRPVWTRYIACLCHNLSTQTRQNRELPSRSLASLGLWPRWTAFIRIARWGTYFRSHSIRWILGACTVMSRALVGGDYYLGEGFSLFRPASCSADFTTLGGRYGALAAVLLGDSVDGGDDVDAMAVCPPSEICHALLSLFYCNGAWANGHPKGMPHTTC